MKKLTPFQSLVLAALWVIVRMLSSIVFDRNIHDELEEETRRVSHWLHDGFTSSEVVGSTKDKVDGTYPDES